MLLHGHSSNPVITGSSVHNQRIERLWRDTFRCVLSLFYQLFYFLEDSNKLDPTSDVDLYCLHYVYVPKINSALKMFADGWNSHALTTEHSMTPSHMFTAGTLMAGRGLVLPCDLTESSSQEITGLDTGSVNVPSTNCPLSTHHVSMLERLVELHIGSQDSYGIELYSDVRDLVYQLIQESETDHE